MVRPPCRWVATPAHIISPACVYGCSVDQQGKRGPFYKGAGREVMAQLTSPAAKAEPLLVGSSSSTLFDALIPHPKSTVPTHSRGLTNGIKALVADVI